MKLYDLQKFGVIITPGPNGRSLRFDFTKCTKGVFEIPTNRWFPDEGSVPDLTLVKKKADERAAKKAAIPVQKEKKARTKEKVEKNIALAKAVAKNSPKEEDEGGGTEGKG